MGTTQYKPRLYDIRNVARVYLARRGLVTPPSDARHSFDRDQRHYPQSHGHDRQGVYNRTQPHSLTLITVGGNVAPAVF